jgi:hypothetical protein
MICAKEGFERPNRDYGAAANLAGRKEFGSNVVLNRSRGNAQHHRRLSNADGKLALLVHARSVEHYRARLR